MFMQWNEVLSHFGGQDIAGLCECSVVAFLSQHHVIDSENQNGHWKGPYRSFSSNPPAMDKDTFH